jgi:uncharacterized protein YqkB
MNLKILTEDISKKINQIFEKDNINKNYLPIKPEIQIKYNNLSSESKAFWRMNIYKSNIELFIKQLPKNGMLNHVLHDIIIGFIYAPPDYNTKNLSVKIQLQNGFAALTAHSELISELNKQSKIKTGDKLQLVSFDSCNISSINDIDLVLEPYKFILPLESTILPILSSTFTSIFLKNFDNNENIYVIYAINIQENKHKNLMNTSWNYQLTDNTWIEAYNVDT